MRPPSLLGLLPSELEALARELGASAYRGRQVATWLYRKGVLDLDAMTDLPKEFRERLRERAQLGTLPLATAARPPHQRVTHLVFMGMGEPLANYANTVRAIRILTDPRYGLGYSPRRITVSTVGLVSGIEKLAREALGVNLSISL